MVGQITISCQDPVVYGQRFLNFLLSVMRGGDVNLRPSGLSPHNNKVDEKPVGGEKSPNESDDGVDRRGEGVDAPTARAMVGHLKAE
jgi:1-phosphatidylinositol-4-phosphate 5-kinase